MKPVLTLLCLLFIITTASAQSIQVVEQGQPCSIRGLSVVDNHVAWVSGSKGHVAITTNGGQTWQWQQVKGFEQSDFRDVEAFSGEEAIIMSSGTPALILKTTDGGQHWNECYRNNDKAYFLDAMAFATPEHGYALGDPINGKFLLLETTNGGVTWNIMKDSPAALPGEAAFAASGTCIKADDQLLTIVTGGSNSRVLSTAISSPDKVWSAHQLPLLHGKDSQGAFSTTGNGQKQIFVGGDYQNNHRTDSVVCYVEAGYHSFSTTNVKYPPAGFQSCVEFIKSGIFISTGTPGSNLTTDNGRTWKQIDTNSFNVCQKAKHGNIVLLAGDGGKIGLFKN